MTSFKTGESSEVIQDYYKNLLDAIPNPIFIKSIYRDTIDYNKAFAMIINNGTKKIKLMDLSKIIGEDIIREMQEMADKALKCNEPQQYNFDINKAYGGLEENEENSFLLNIAPYMDVHGNAAGVVGSMTDITEIKKNEELKKLMEENIKLLTEAMEYDKIKNEFFANISHELRTPLNVILGVLQLLIIYSDEEAINLQNMDRYLHIMKQNCYRLLRLVNNLIDITKMDAGFFQIKLKSNNIVRIVEDITLSVADYIEEKGIILEFDTNVEEKIINCDPDQIERILLNLLSNSIKFTSSGGKIGVFLYDKGDSIVIRVKDTGIGIPEDKQEFIFERFRQVDKSLTRDHEGSGIGLSLVKSLVEMHGGTINVISKEGVGSEFIIEIPVGEDLNYNEEEIPVTEGINIERIKVEFSDIYPI